MITLKIISATVRPTRKGPIVANWIKKVAEQHGGFAVELLDLGEVNLPLMNEPKHPRLRQYEHQYTKDWSAKIDAADAFIFVTAEYDYGYPAPLRNALEYLSHEWAYKAAGMVSYGGVSAGTRAWNALKGDLSTFKMVPIMESVNIPFFEQLIKDDVLEPNETMTKAAGTMLQEIVRWTKGLQVVKNDQ